MIKAELSVGNWLERNGWSDAVDDEFAAKCGVLLKTLSAPTDAAVIHRVCMAVLSPMVYHECLEGTPERRDAAYRSLADYLARMAFTRLGDRDLALEMSQLVVAEIHKAIHAQAIRDPQAFLGFCQTALLRAVSRMAAERARSDQVVVSLEETTSDDPDSDRTWGDVLMDMNPGVEEIVESADVQSAFWRCLARCKRLSVRSMQILYLLFRHEWSPQRICRRLGLTLNAFFVALHRAKKTLREDVTFRNCVGELALS